MALQFEAVELWRNRDGEMIRRKVVQAPDRPSTRVVDYLSRRQTDWSFGGWAEKVPANDPKYSEYDAAKEAARFTSTPFEAMRNLLNLGHIFAYQKASEIPVIGVIELKSDGTIAERIVRQGHFDTIERIFFHWRSRTMKDSVPWPPGPFENRLRKHSLIK